MREFRNAHLWLIIPCAIVLLGFAPSYWLRLADAPWRQHLHGLSATLWFLLLIAQPYLVTRGHVAQHRRYGMIALVVAGGVALSAYNVIPFTFEIVGLPDLAKYAFSFVDLLLILGFILAVVMAIIHAKKSADHARWMISTVFWALSPGLFRLLNIVGAPDAGIPPTGRADADGCRQYPGPVRPDGARPARASGLPGRCRRKHRSYCGCAGRIAGVVAGDRGRPVSNVAPMRSQIHSMNPQRTDSQAF